jgi:hypothetical protein
MSTISEALELLDKAAKQFRFYETQHLAKVPEIARQIFEDRIGQRGRDLIDATEEKARVNGALAIEIEEFLTNAG